MPKLTDSEITDFLDEPGHLARIASVDADGFSRVVPLAWRYFRPGTKWAH